MFKNPIDGILLSVFDAMAVIEIIVTEPVYESLDVVLQGLDSFFGNLANDVNDTDIAIDDHVDIDVDMNGVRLCVPTEDFTVQVHQCVGVENNGN